MKKANYNNEDLFLSIIIVNYNTFKLTTQCIQSIFGHTNNVQFEIILVDNGSSECNPNLFIQQFPEIQLIKSIENLGFSKGNNLGIKQSKGDFILLLNSDTKLKNNAIKTILDYLLSHPKAGVVSSKLIFPDGKHQSACQRFPSIRFQLFELLRLQKLFKGVSGKILLGAFFDHNTNIEVDWVWGTCFLFRREILKRMPGGRLNEEFFMYSEDMQWCMDIKRQGYQIHYCADAEVIHYMGGSSGNKSELMKRNNALFLRNNFTFIHRWSIILLSKLLNSK
jgi:GT2 family glycosyltransferase